MLVDKITWSRAPGHWFAMFGIAQFTLYGFSLISNTENFDYYFGYTGDGRFFQPFRSMIASERFYNAAGNSFALIVGGTYLQSKIGVMASTKFFAMTLLSTYLFTVSFGVASPLSSLNLRPLWHKFINNSSNFDDEKKQMMGADGLAFAVIYMILFYHRLFPIAAALAVSDVSYYGPFGIGAPACAGVAFLTLL